MGLMNKEHDPKCFHRLFASSRRTWNRLLMLALIGFVTVALGNKAYAQKAQAITVSGTVTAEGEPLIGVTVQVVGSTAGGGTHVGGKFLLSDWQRAVGGRSVEV